MDERMELSKTINGGSNWTRYTLTSVEGYTYALAVDPSNSSIVYAGGTSETGVTLYKTTSSGGSWSPVSAGISGDTIHDIAIDPVATNTVYVTTADGVFKSTNAGANWTNKGCSSARAIVIDPTAPSNLYAGTWTGVYRSTDGGNTWEQINDGLETLHITSLELSPDIYLYCGTDSFGIYRLSLQVGITENESEPGSNIIYFARPNPAKNKTTIYFGLNASSKVRLAIYDIQGRMIKILTDDKYADGTHQVSWNGLDQYNKPVTSGVYFYQLLTDQEVRTQKLVKVE